VSHLPLEPAELETRIRALVVEELARATSAAPRSRLGSVDGRRRRPRGRVVALLLAGLLAVAPVSLVLATHFFPDVPDGTTHAAPIERIAKAGITAGCGGTANYCPSDPVARDQMATFLNRSLGRVAMGEQGTFNTISVAAGVDSSNAYHVGSVTITVPGANNSFTPNQFVKIDSGIEVFDALTTGKGCECSFVILLAVSTSEDLYPVAVSTFRQTASGDRSYGMSGIGVFPAAPGVKTYEVWVAMYDRATTTNAATFDVYSDQLVATTFAFGPTGGNTGITPGGSSAAGFTGRPTPVKDASNPQR
jgi:hypothetical protein